MKNLAEVTLSHISMKQIGVGIIGCGGIVLQNHLPGLKLCPEAKLTALCDSNPAVLQTASAQTGVKATHADYHELVKREDVQAVIIATPNFVHAPMALAAIAAGKHVLCEKPIAMNHGESAAMLRAAEAAKVRHMTAFTYRFVPAMNYMAHLVRSGFIGRPYHFRSCRLQDWGTRAVGWRQVAKLAGTGGRGRGSKARRLFNANSALHWRERRCSSANADVQYHSAEQLVPPMRIG